MILWAVIVLNCGSDAAEKVYMDLSVYCFARVLNRKRKPCKLFSATSVNLSAARTETETKSLHGSGPIVFLALWGRVAIRQAESSFRLCLVLEDLVELDHGNGFAESSVKGSTGGMHRKVYMDRSLRVFFRPYKS